MTPMIAVYEFLGAVIVTGAVAPAVVSGTTLAVTCYFDHHPQRQARLLAAFDRR